MDLEKLKTLTLENQKEWRKLTELKIKDIINNVQNPQWDDIFSFFHNQNTWDSSHIQAPCYALEYSNDVSAVNTKFYLYLHVKYPIYTCFFMKTGYDVSIEGRKIIISNNIKDANFDFTLKQVIRHVKKVFPHYQYLSHSLLFQNRVQWGMPLGGFEKDLGSYIFEYLFYDFTIITDQLTIKEL
jgi:hypothetical protein